MEMSTSVYFSSINSINFLTIEDEIKLIKAKQNGDSESRDRLINSYLPLVVKIAYQYNSNFSTHINDIIQEGNLGLIKAVEKFDPNFGFKFAAYASFWIKKYIVYFMYTKINLITIPIRKYYEYGNIKKVKNILLNDSREESTPEEIAKFLHIREDDVEDIIKIFNPVSSIDCPVDNNGLDFVKTLEDDNFLSPEKLYFREELKRELNNIVHILSDMEKEIVIKSYGLNGSEKYTIYQLGELYDVSYQTISNIRKKALIKLKNKFHYLKDFFD